MQGTPDQPTVPAGGGPPGTAGGGSGGGGRDGGDGTQDGVTSRIAGLSILKGLLLYGATLAFAGLYAYFIYKIVNANGERAHLDSAMVASAAALAGVLGSAFALVIGTTTPAVNRGLKVALESLTPPEGEPEPSVLDRVLVHLRRVLSFEPGDTNQPSWPLTFGIWAYAAVAAATAATYILNRAETPPDIKALAIAFAGYVLAFVNAAYGIASKTS
jgi:hypothetical protein